MDAAGRGRHGEYGVGDGHSDQAQELNRLLGFVRERFTDLTRVRDPHTLRWGMASLDVLDAMEAHLRAVPASEHELRRFLLRLAALHRHHVDYEPHWGLDIPAPCSAHQRGRG